MSRQRATPPDATTMKRQPPIGRASIFRVAAHATAVSEARRRAAELIRAWNCEVLAETVELLVSELTTNAMRASGVRGERDGRRPDDRDAFVALRLTCTGTSVVLEVWDRNEAVPVLREPGLEDESGRGLWLVCALSTQWAYYRPRTGGKVVWCECALQPVVVGGKRADTPAPLPRRKPSAERGDPIEFLDDMVVLQRVIEGLRRLDEWVDVSGRDTKPHGLPATDGTRRDGVP